MDILKAKFAWVLVPVCLVQASLKKKKNAMWKGFTGKKKFILKKRSVSNGTEYDSLLTTVGQGHLLD